MVGVEMDEENYVVRNGTIIFCGNPANIKKLHIGRLALLSLV